MLMTLTAVRSELDRLTTEFFRAVSFESDETPPYENIRALFVEAEWSIATVAIVNSQAEAVTRQH